MTISHPRRDKQTQAYDILAKLLKAQEAKAQKLYDAYARKGVKVIRSTEASS